MDIDQLTDVLARLKRVQGQVGGVIGMIAEGQDCTKVVTQLVAAPGRWTRPGSRSSPPGWSNA